jgi:rRNA-processing protein FCF1
MAIWEALTQRRVPKESYEVLDFWGYENLFSNDRTVSEQEHLQQDTGESYSLEGLIKGSYYIHIDSNIWMDKDVETFFQNLERFLQKYKKTLVIPNYQLGELWKIKDRNSQSEENQEERSFKVELALERIERLQKKRLLKIEELTLTRAKDVYADPQIIRTLEQKAENGEKVALITNDVELRIRTRSILRQKGFSYIVDGTPRFYTNFTLREYEQEKPVTAVDNILGLLLGAAGAFILHNCVGPAIVFFFASLIIWFVNFRKIKTYNCRRISFRALFFCSGIFFLDCMLKYVFKFFWEILSVAMVISFIIGAIGTRSKDN